MGRHESYRAVSPGLIVVTVATTPSGTTVEFTHHSCPHSTAPDTPRTPTDRSPSTLLPKVLPYRHPQLSHRPRRPVMGTCYVPESGPWAVCPLRKRFYSTTQVTPCFLCFTGRRAEVSVPRPLFRPLKYGVDRCPDLRYVLPVGYRERSRPPFLYRSSDRDFGHLTRSRIGRRRSSAPAGCTVGDADREWVNPLHYYCRFQKTTLYFFTKKILLPRSEFVKVLSFIDQRVEYGVSGLVWGKDSVSPTLRGGKARCLRPCVGEGPRRGTSINFTRSVCLSGSPGVTGTCFPGEKLHSRGTPRGNRVPPG